MLNIIIFTLFVGFLLGIVAGVVGYSTISNHFKIRKRSNYSTASSGLFYIIAISLAFAFDLKILDFLVEYTYFSKADEYTYTFLAIISLLVAIAISSKIESDALPNNYYFKGILLNIVNIFLISCSISIVLYNEILSKIIPKNFTSLDLAGILLATSSISLTLFIAILQLKDDTKKS